jgi:hypothetical protein
MIIINYCNTTTNMLYYSIYCVFAAAPTYLPTYKQQIMFFQELKKNGLAMP